MLLFYWRKRISFTLQHNNAWIINQAYLKLNNCGGGNIHRELELVANTICNCHMTLLIILVFKGRFNNNNNNPGIVGLKSARYELSPVV